MKVMMIIFFCPGGGKRYTAPLGSPSSGFSFAIPESVAAKSLSEGGIGVVFGVGHGWLVQVLSSVFSEITYRFL